MNFNVFVFSGVCCLVLSIGFTDSGSLRYCVPENMVYGTGELNETCKRFNEVQHEIQCVMAEDRLGCFLMLLDGTIDFMVAEPEDLKLVQIFNTSNVVITHQLAKFAKSMQPPDTEMLVIVKNYYVEPYTTKGKKLCYLGLENTSLEQFDEYYTSYFESWLYPQNCNPERSLLENRLASLSDYFDSACMAGPWSPDPDLDVELKAKYKNLCALCYNGCDEQDRYFGMHGVVTCLEQRGGDVGWVNKPDVKEYIPVLQSYGYSLLCMDGKLANFSDYENDCTWIINPRPVILANKAVANVVYQNIIDEYDEEGVKFFNLIHDSYKFNHLSKIENIQNIADYLGKFSGYLKAMAKSESSCQSQRKFRWCVSSSLEKRKCQSLQKAAKIAGIQPIFMCVEKNSRHECIQAVANGICDVFVALPHEMVQARKLGTKAIIDLMAHNHDDSNAVAAIVKRKSRYNTFKDLKGAKACFTGYKSTGWNTLLLELKKVLGALKCSDLETISNFFQESCVLGLDVENYEYPENLYSLCNTTESKLTIEEQTFQCLMDGADVAFVNVSAAKAYSSLSKIFNVEYRLLCPMGQDDYLSPCYLGQMTLGSILVHENISHVRERDVYLALLELDKHFGRTFQMETSMFEMYEPFQMEFNVIFPNATVKLKRAMPGSYGEDLTFSNDATCKPLIKRSSTSTATVFFVLVFLVLLGVAIWICISHCPSVRRSLDQYSRILILNRYFYN